MLTCGDCQIWAAEDFDQTCPRMRSQLNDLNNKLVSLKAKQKDPHKPLGSPPLPLYIVGVGSHDESCSKFIPRTAS